MDTLILPTVAFAGTIAAILICGPLARRFGLVSNPGAHRRHQGRVPLVGGIAMFFGVILATQFSPVSLQAYRPLFAAASLLILVGVLDDVRELRPWLRFALQGIATLIVIAYGGTQLADLGALIGTSPLTLGALGGLFTLFAMVGVINAVNLIDGADGLAGGIAGIVFLLLAAAAGSVGRVADASMLLTLAGAVSGFLLFNLRYPGHRRAKLFMGDAGSLFIGLALAWFLVSLSQGPNRAIAPATALWLMALPLLDTVTVMLRRALNGRSPVCAGRDHLHHLLPALGLSEGRMVAGMLLLTLLLGGLAAGSQALGIAEVWLFAAFCALAGLYLAGVTWGWRRVKLADCHAGGRQRQTQTDRVDDVHDLGGMAPRARCNRVVELLRTRQPARP